MNSREWEAYEAKAQEYENRLDREARFREPTDDEIRAELMRRATEHGATVEQLCEMNRIHGW